MKKFLLLLCILSITQISKAQLFKSNWLTGSYTNFAGKEFPGLIFNNKGDHLLYKTDKDAEKQKIPAEQIKSFTIGTDSFTVSHSKLLKHFPFIQIIIDHQTKLYYSAFNPTLTSTATTALVGGAIGAAAFNSRNSAYYFGPDPDNLTVIKSKNFIETMSTLMADKPEVVSKIKDKTFKLYAIADLLTYYKTGILSKQQKDDVY